MSSARAWIASSVLLSFGLLPFPAVAQYAVEQQSSVWLKGLFDVRAVGGGPAPSWTEGGPGKLRYGGSSSQEGLQRSTRLTLSQAAVQIGATLPWGIRGQVQLNMEPNIADGYHPWLVEALLRKEWTAGNGGWGLQTGVMHVPFSLENVGPAWSPEYSISSSALNSWLWEDISLAGAEGEWWHTTGTGIKLDAVVGAGAGADQTGRLLALRGWVMGDTLSGINGSLALPGRSERTDIFNERDQRPALYGSLSLGDEADTVSVKLGMFDNSGDESSRGVWHTHFTTAGLAIHATSHIDLLTQFLTGTARVAAPPNDSSFRATYGLASYHFRQQRVSLRYDQFRVHDLDGGPTSTNEHGNAVTASYQVQFGLRHRIALEHIWMYSHRDATGSLDPTPDGWQVGYRFRF
ncbi:MAG: hypothetical protein JSR66_18210 [Proteobacteria bacterium]|nr:hypothetical protein [Pseudomonadota bacterium]